MYLKYDHASLPKGYCTDQGHIPLCEVSPCAVIIENGTYLKSNISDGGFLTREYPDTSLENNFQSYDMITMSVG